MFPISKTLTLSFALALGVAWLLIGCGAYETREVGLETETRLILRGERLTGLTVSIDEQFTMQISKADLTPYEMSILGAKNSMEENFEAATFLVDPGSRRIRVSGNGGVILEREIYFTEGQTRELVLR